MSPSKRERDYARRRYNDWQSRQQAKAARVRQLRKVAIVIASIAVAVAVIALVYSAARPDPDAATTPAPPSASPTQSGAACGSTGELSSTPRTVAKSAPKPQAADKLDSTGVISTNCGSITVELDGTKAPQAVANFRFLAEKKFYDHTECHRLVITGIYVLQCGDPTGTGQGGPGYTFGPVENAPASNVYPAGTIAMARASNKADSNGSQFFIVYKDSTIPADSAGGYTVFGKVKNGLDMVNKVAAGGTQTGSEKPARPIAIESVEIK